MRDPRDVFATEELRIDGSALINEVDGSTLEGGWDADMKLLMDWNSEKQKKFVSINNKTTNYTTDRIAA